MKQQLSALGLSIFLAFVALVGAVAIQPAAAEEKDRLFVNLVTDDAHGATMALHFAKTMQEQGR